MRQQSSRSSVQSSLLVLGTLALAGSILHRSYKTEHHLSFGHVDACSPLPGLPGQLCSSYHGLTGPEKFTAAVHWRQLSPSTYACSGITVDCLQEDMHSSSPRSSCKPLLEGAFCQTKKQRSTCRKGFCGGRPRHVEPADPNFQPGASSSFAPVSFVAPQQQQQQGVVGRVQSAFTSLLTSAAAASAVEPDADLAARRSLQAVSAQVDPNWPTAVGVIKFRETQRRVPETFLATSHEWTRLTDYGGQSADAWAEIFRTLSPSPVLRIGGATQDKLIHVPKDETWVALQQLQKKTNTRFVIGLPLFQKNAVEMSKQMMGQAKKYLGSSVIQYELGNEPEFWPAGLGGYNETGDWKPGFAAYTQWFDRVARSLNPCGTPAFLSGPGWGNLNTQDPNWLRIVLNNGKSCGYLSEANAHYYPYIDNTTVTAEQLLSQPLQDVGLARLKAYVDIAWNNNNLQLRISEANSLYGGGRADLSDTMAGTLWVADALFTFAANGARAFHLHWGHGGLPYQGGSPNVGVQTNFDYNTPFPYKPYPSVHAPWFGYLFWVMASAGGYSKNADTQFVSASINKPSPPPPPPAPVSAPANSSSGSNSSSAAPASVITEKGGSDKPTSGNQTTTTSSSSSSKNRRLTHASSPGAMQAWQAAAEGSSPATKSSGSKEPSFYKGMSSAAGSSQLAKTPIKEFARDYGREFSSKDYYSSRAPSAPSKQQQVVPGKVQQLQAYKGRSLLAVSAGCDANMKLWALKVSDSTLRVAILNKDSNKNCNIKVTIPDASHLCKAGQKAELTRLLPGPQGMSSKSGLSWQGQHYDDASVAASGKLVGAKAASMVAATEDADECAYVIGMPKASGALLIINA